MEICDGGLRRIKILLLEDSSTGWLSCFIFPCFSHTMDIGHCRFSGVYKNCTQYTVNVFLFLYENIFNIYPGNFQYCLRWASIIVCIYYA